MSRIVQNFCSLSYFDFIDIILLKYYIMFINYKLHTYVVTKHIFRCRLFSIIIQEPEKLCRPCNNNYQLTILLWIPFCPKNAKFKYILLKIDYFGHFCKLLAPYSFISLPKVCKNGQKRAIFVKILITTYVHNIALMWSTSASWQLFGGLSQAKPQPLQKFIKSSNATIYHNANHKLISVWKLWPLVTL